MFERAGTAAFDYALHEGSPMRIQWHFFERTRLPVAVQTWELPPGGVEGMHAHPEDDPLEELYLVVDGQATMSVDGESYHLGPGDSVLAPVGSQHDVRNTGTGPLKLVIVWGRPGAADFSGFGTTAVAREAARRANGST